MQAGNETTDWAAVGTGSQLLAPAFMFFCASRPTAVAGIPHGCGKASVTSEHGLEQQGLVVSLPPVAWSWAGPSCCPRQPSQAPTLGSIVETEHSPL